MNNNKLTRILLIIGSFAVFFTLSFWGIRFIKDSSKNQEVIVSEEPIEDDVTTDNSTNDPAPQSIIINSVPKTHEIKEEKTTIVCMSFPKLNGETYNFRVGAKNLPPDITCHYELWNNDGDMVQSSNNGLFSEVSSNEKGKYTIRLVDSNGNIVASRVLSGFKAPKPELDPVTTETNPVTTEPEPVTTETNPVTTEPEPVKPKKMLISKEDFQKRLLDENDMTLKYTKKATDKKNILAYNFKMTIIGTKSDEKKIPSDLEAVREKISFGSWKSAVVTDISYDEKTGQVTGVTIKPTYY